MKHIFTVHSPITFLVAYSVIEHLELQEKDVILISSNYKSPIDKFKVVPSFAEKNSSFFAKLKAWNVPVHHDKYISEITGGEKFTAYIDLMSYYQRILVTHKDCGQFHFIEEGNSTFQAYDDITDATWHERSLLFRSKIVHSKSLTRVFRGFNLRLLSMPYNYMAYANFKNLNFYVLSENAFFAAPKSKKVILKPNTEKKDIIEMAGGHQLENEVIWLDGSNARYTGLDESYYHRAIQTGIDVFKSKGVIADKVYVKLRPGIKDISKIKLVSILRQNKIKVEVLPNDMIIECFFMRAKNCKVIGNLTSALEYAHVFGHKAYSIYPYFEKQPPTFFDRMTGFWKNVKNVTN